MSNHEVPRMAQASDDVVTEIINSFLRRVIKHRRENGGEFGELKNYVVHYPGYEDVIASEFAKLRPTRV